MGKYFFFLLITIICHSANAQKIITVNPFDKVIVSPHIQATFIEGDEEKVTIEKSTVGNDKINIEVNGTTLRVYLDDAKEVTKNKTVYENGHKVERPIYQGTVVTATITYKTLDALSVRGEETLVCKSLLKGTKFRLRIYGESQVFINEVSLAELQATIYGESLLEIKSGSITDQKFTAYGESKINSLGIKSNSAKITAYGEAGFQVNVSDEIKITSYGEAKLKYKGNPKIVKGLNIGKVQIDKTD